MFTRPGRYWRFRWPLLVFFDTATKQQWGVAFQSHKKKVSFSKYQYIIVYIIYIYCHNIYYILYIYIHYIYTYILYILYYIYVYVSHTYYKYNYGKADENGHIQKVQPQVRSYGLEYSRSLQPLTAQPIFHLEAKPLNVGVQEHHRQIQTMNAGRLLPWESANRGEVSSFPLFKSEMKYTGLRNRVPMDTVPSFNASK